MGQRLGSCRQVDVFWSVQEVPGGCSIRTLDREKIVVSCTLGILHRKGGADTIGSQQVELLALVRMTMGLPSR